MKIAICDDSMLDRSIISNFLRMYLQEYAIPFSFTEYASGKPLLYDVEDGAYYDIVFMDILMDEIHGMEAARNLRRMGFGGKIVFLTCTAECAVDSYEVEAVGYLLKPHDFGKFCALMDRIVQPQSKGQYAVTIRNRVITIPFREIVYVESNNNVCVLHRNDGTEYTIYKKLSEIEQQLCDLRFLRCHQSYLVNMSYIAKADKQFELTTGAVVLIRQRSLKEMRQAYIDYTKQERML